MMNYTGIVLLLCLFAQFTLPLGTNQNERTETFAVVELFTAEGCSSCPKADELLKEMGDILSRENINVMGLAFHVTYWNKYGWEDPYSQEQFTERQKRYVSKLTFTQLQTPQVYTPQAIVNGETEFLGSNPFKFRESVISASGKNAKYEIVAEITEEDGKTVLHYELNREPKNVVLNIAVVEHYIEHFVSRGENKNRTLKHNNVVRTFEGLAPKRKGIAIISWPGDLLKDKGSIVVYVQDSKTLQIIGASKLNRR